MVGWPAKFNSRSGVEDAETCDATIPSGRKDEYRLRKIQLARNALHRPVIQPLRFRKHRQRVTFESVLREDGYYFVTKTPESAHVIQV